MMRPLALLITLAMIAACDDDPAGAVPDAAAIANPDAAVALDAGGPDAAAPLDAEPEAEPDAEPDALAPDLGPIGGDRPARVHPASADVPGPHPVLVLLHGYRATPGLVQNTYRFHERGPERGVVVVTPSGTQDADGFRFWDAEHCCEERMVDDVGYILGVIDEVIARYDGDPERVWIVGHSNGGYMAHHLACVAADRIAGVAPIAGLGYPRADCAPSRPISVLQIHGDADDQVPIDGNGTQPAAAALAGWWAERAGCDAVPTEARADLEQIAEGDETVVQRWTGCAPGVRVEHWRMGGVGHLMLPQAAFLDRVLDAVEGR